MAHRHADRGRHHRYLHCGGASVRRQQFGGAWRLGQGARPSLARGGRRRGLSRAHLDQPLLGAGACHLHVRVDGEVRRRARRAHRHPRGRRRAGRPALAVRAHAGRRVRVAVRRLVHRRDRHARRGLRLRTRRRSGVAGIGVAELDHLPVHSARLLPDVLPLPAGRLAFPAHRLQPASRSRSGGGKRRPAARDGAGARAMTSVSHASPERTRSSAVIATLMIVMPIALALLCLAARLDIVLLSQSMRATLLFALLLALMASGIPISIALGLSVLTYLFILSSVDPKMVGLKLFTSIDRFEIMAIPFFILAGNFLTSGGVARRMIAFATSLIGHWYGGLGLAGVVACALFAAICGSSVATVVGIGSLILPAPPPRRSP